MGPPPPTCWGLVGPLQRRGYPGLCGRAHDWKIPADDLVELQPGGETSGQMPVALDDERSPCYIAPHRMTKKDRNEIGDPALKYQVDLKAGILCADIDAGALQHQPHDAEFAAARRHPCKFETHDHTAFR